ncbi:MAG: hypothetical protein HUJ94_08790 [Bacteroidales bacterium]|nr:hypothetical protein [Bacteroidales bacterium]
MRCPDLEGFSPRPMVVVEDLWRRRPQMMKQRLLAHLGHSRQVFARNCDIRRIDKPLAAAFLEASHSWGDASCRFRYGMFTRRSTGGKEEKLPAGTLVAVSTFSSARNWVKDGSRIRSCEWTRYASLPGLRVVGGMGRMLNYFLEDTGVDDVMSYADLEWSDGEVYRELGFTEEGRREGVSFVIDRDSWERRPMSGAEVTAAGGSSCIYTNPGSLKFRLRVRQG